jgi:hypothetical protein
MLMKNLASLKKASMTLVRTCMEYQKYVMFVDREISKIGAGNMSNLDQE